MNLSRSTRNNKIRCRGLNVFSVIIITLGSFDSTFPLIIKREKVYYFIIGRIKFLKVDHLLPFKFKLIQACDSIYIRLRFIAVQCVKIN